jgi:hypothetical protein
MAPMQRQARPQRQIAPMQRQATPRRQMAPMQRQATPQRQIAPRIAAPRPGREQRAITTFRRNNAPQQAVTPRDIRRAGRREIVRQAPQLRPDRDAARIVRQNDVGRRSVLAGQARQRPEALVNRNVGNRSWALRNRGFAETNARNPAARALARATFAGRFANRAANASWDWNDRRHWRRHRLAVIGWVGPVFWPYAYSDVIDYTFWPYAYDAFWPYAYDEVYEGFFGPYAVGGPVYASVGSGTTGRTSGPAARTPARSQNNAALNAGAQICTEQASGLTDWPIARIAETVEPDAAQRAALDELQAAAANAVAMLQSACPDALPSTPTGRLAAMRARIETMRQALHTVQPALERFYNSLSDGATRR